MARRQKFAPSRLTHSATHHLMAADDAIRTLGYARVTDIARQLGLTRGSVSVAMQSLRGAGLVSQDANGFFHLTARGQTVASSVRRRRQVVEEFLSQVLGLSPEQAHRESCRMENLLEAGTTRRLYSLVEYWRQHKLEGVLDGYPCSACPDCGKPVRDCPCCGLECIDGTCPLREPSDG